MWAGVLRTRGRLRVTVSLLCLKPHMFPKAQDEAKALTWYSGPLPSPDFFPISAHLDFGVQPTELPREAAVWAQTQASALSSLWPAPDLLPAC